MRDSVIKTMDQFKDNLIKAGMLAVKETLYTSYEFEIVSISFNIDYDDARDTYTVYDCKITFNYGDPKGDHWSHENAISINTIPEYNLDDINYLYGLFYGYFSGITQEAK